jgi:hypothetical protein
MKSTMSKVFLGVLLASAILACLNSALFFTSILNKPDGTIYLGTIHYWEDYFFYLNHFFQGAHGMWLTHNRFTTETLPSSFIYWNNVILGKIGGVFGLSPILSYNVSVLLLSFCALVLSFLLLVSVFRLPPPLAFIGFLFANLSASLPNIVTSNEGKRIIWPYQIWGTPHFAFDRLGGSPNQLERTVGFYLLLCSAFLPLPKTTKRFWQFIILMGSVSALYATVNPVQALSFAALVSGITVLACIFTRKLPGRQELIRLLALVIPTGLFYLATAQAMDISPYKEAKVWEMVNQSHTTFLFLLASIGPVLPFALAGLLARAKNLTRPEWFGALFLLISYTVFMSPIPAAIGVSNLRVLFPALYIFWGAFAAWGLSFCAQFIARKTRIKPPAIRILLLAVFLIVTLPTFNWELGWKFPKTVDRTDPLLYLPTGVYDGFMALGSRSPYDDAAIGNPASHMDTLIPPLSGHTTYTGHIAATLNKDAKIPLSLAFFTKSMTAETAKTFLKENHIRFVVFTFYDGDRILFEQTYPFLSKIFENTQTAVYETQ